MPSIYTCTCRWRQSGTLFAHFMSKVEGPFKKYATVRILWNLSWTFIVTSEIKKGGQQSCRKYRWRQSGTYVCKLHCLPLRCHLYKRHDRWPTFLIWIFKGYLPMKVSARFDEFLAALYLLNGLSILGVKLANFVLLWRHLYFQREFDNDTMPLTDRYMLMSLKYI